MSRFARRVKARESAELKQSSNQYIHIYPHCCIITAAEATLFQPAIRIDLTIAITQLIIAISRDP